MAPITIAGIVLSAHSLGSLGITLALLVLLYFFFRYTDLGLAMRAAAQYPVPSRLVGIRAGWMLALGWGLAAALWAVAGMLVGPVLFLEPNMMACILIFTLASATLASLTSPYWAPVGGVP